MGRSIIARAARRRRRQHPDPLRDLPTASSSSTGASRPCASRPPTSSAPRCATCSSCAASASPTSTPRSSRRRCPQLAPEWEAMAARYLGHEMLVVGPGIRTGMAMRYDNPREIGADRLVNAVAAYEQGRRRRASWSTSAPRSPTTRSRPRASTSAASSRPGVEISMEALTTRAAKLPQDRARAAALADRQVDGRRDPQRRHLRLRRPGRRRSCAACAPSWARRPRRSPPAAWPSTSCRSPRTIDEVDDLLTLTGPALLHERNA